MSTVPVTNVSMKLSSAPSEEILGLSLPLAQITETSFHKAAEPLLQHFGDIHITLGELLG